MSLRSVDGAVALLGDPQLASHALELLIHSVETHWHTISDVLSTIEALAAAAEFAEREKASLLASKLYFHLDRIDSAIHYAMTAGAQFDASDSSDYTRAVMGAGVVKYCAARQAEFARIIGNFEAEDEEACAAALGNFVYNPSSSSAVSEPDARFERLLEDMILGAAQDAATAREVCGVCIEARRFDILKKFIDGSENKMQLLNYCLKVSQSSIRSRWLVVQIVSLVFAAYSVYLPTRSESGGWREVENALPVLLQEALSLGSCMAILRLARPLAEFMAYLLATAGDDGELLTLQIAFDLQAMENQKFTADVLESLQPLLADERVAAAPSESAADGGLTARGNSADLLRPDVSIESSAEESCEEDAVDGAGDNIYGASQEGPEPLAGAASATEPKKTTDAAGALGANAPTQKTSWEKLQLILHGEAALDLGVWYLHKHNRADLNGIEKIKCTVDSRSSLLVTAVALSQALALAGTTSDAFVRNNLDWLSRATCWSKFVVAGSTGVLHRGHVSAARTVLAAYLPQPGSNVSGGPYSEGGALFALGLILANRYRESECEYLCDMVKKAEQHCATNYEPLQVGGCLGLGLLAMSTCNAAATEALRHVLFVDSAVGGEAAALGLGMVHLGSLDGELALQLLDHARETEHERVRRGAALGVALLAFGKEEQSDAVIESLMNDKLDALRQAAQWGIGLAFCGTGHSKAVRQLLQKGLSDLCPDVRRAAVLALAFVLARRPKELERIMSLLSDSYDPHVRYGAALGLGLAGELVYSKASGSSGVVQILLRLAEDSSDFVRQAAFMGLGMALCQAHPAAVPEVRDVRDLFNNAVSRKHEEALARFGAIVGTGLLEVAGKNGGFSLCNANGAVRAESAVGLLLFFNQWHWHPYILGVSLAVKPQALIGLDQDLKVPTDFFVKCDAAVAEKAAYYEAPTNAANEAKSSTIAAVLTQRRRRKRRAPETPQRPQTQQQQQTQQTQQTQQPQQQQQQQSNDDTTKAEDHAEAAAASRVNLANPIRVLPFQAASITVEKGGSGWWPVDPEKRTGFVFLKPLEPMEESKDPETMPPPPAEKEEK